MNKSEFQKSLYVLDNVMETNENYRKIFERIDKQNLEFTRKGFNYWYGAFKEIDTLKTNEDVEKFLKKHICTNHEFSVSSFVSIDYAMRGTVNAIRNKWFEINSDIKYKNEDEKMMLFGQFLQKTAPDNMDDMMEEAELNEREFYNNIIEPLNLPKMTTRCFVCKEYTRDRYECKDCGSQNVYCSPKCFEKHECK